MKGQVNLEFLSSAFIYLAALGVLVTLGSGILPEFSSSVDQASLNLEARQLTTGMLTQPGSETYTGTTDWEKNSTTVRYADSFGLAVDYMEVSRAKVERLRTINPRGDRNYLNYSQFKELTRADNQYRFNFTWMPIVETYRSFTRGEGDDPSTPPDIDEPETGYYLDAGNTVHYGSRILMGERYYFLVTSHDGIYNTTYVSTDPDGYAFENRQPYGVGDTPFELRTEGIKIESFQNRPREPGSILVLSQHVKTFGAALSDNTDTIRMVRYAVMDGEPLKVEVLAW